MSASNNIMLAILRQKNLEIMNLKKELRTQVEYYKVIFELQNQLKNKNETIRILGQDRSLRHMD